MIKSFILTCLFCVLLSCASQNKMYRTVIQENTVEGYKKYLEKYPSGEHRDQIYKLLEEKEFELAQQTNTIKSYNKYISAYPKSTHLEKAKNLLQKKEWENVLQQNSIYAYKKFEQKYPQSEYTPLIKAFFDKPENKCALRMYWDFPKGQIVQWASNVEDFSSEYDYYTFYESHHILGKPNVYTKGELSKYAWLPKEKNSSFEFIKVEFEPMAANQILIFESYNPGAIKHVLIYDENHNEHKIISPTNIQSSQKHRLLKIKTPKTINVKAVKLVLDCSIVPDWNNFDAIGITDSFEDFSYFDFKQEINLVKDIQFEIHPENLGQAINSEYADISPQISPDGKTLYFTRKEHPVNLGTNNNDDIWTSQLNKQGTWEKAVNIGKPLNDDSYNAVFSITPDGNTLLVNGAYDEEGNRKSGTSISHKIKNGWGEPQQITIENYINKNKYVGFSLANNRQILLLAVERDDSFGDKDIYVGFLSEDNTWTEPLNLGCGINTNSNEHSPFLAADNKTLYFSSAGHPGYGGADIFLSKRLDDTWQNWSLPQNIGRPLNSDRYDQGFNIPASGQYAYFASTKSGYGKSDIFRIKLPQGLRPEPVVLVYGKVFNANTNAPISAEIIYETLPEGERAGIAHSDPNTGEYKITLPFGALYAFHATSDSFIGINDNMDLTNLTYYDEKERNLYMKPIEKGETIRLNNIFFDFAKFELKEESIPELKRIIKILTENPTMKIKITGHTDDIGSTEDNMILSHNRAKAVADYFVNNGIHNKRVQYEGFGESKHLASNETEEGRAINRRVEFVILEI